MHDLAAAVIKYKVKSARPGGSGYGDSRRRLLCCGWRGVRRSAVGEVESGGIRGTQKAACTGGGMFHKMLDAGGAGDSGKIRSI